MKQGWSIAAVVVAAGLFGLNGCRSAPPADASRPPGTSPPSSTKQKRSVGNTDGAAMGDDLQSLEAELTMAQRELQMIEAGEPEPRSAENKTRPTRVRPDRCERIEALAEQICDLQDRMCRLADEHDGESKYARACDNATQTCEDASAAAETCE